MLVKVRNFSKTYALFATLSDPMELVQHLRVFTEEKPPRLKVFPTRKLLFVILLTMICFNTVVLFPVKEENGTTRPSINGSSPQLTMLQVSIYNNS